MKILVQGNRNRLLQPKKFSCLYCGCVFIADNTEYIDESTQRDRPTFTVNCPCCDNTVWSYSTSCVDDVDE